MSIIPDHYCLSVCGFPDDLKAEWEKRLSEEKASAEQLQASQIQVRYIVLCRNKFTAESLVPDRTTAIVRNSHLNHLYWYCCGYETGLFDSPVMA